MHDDLSRGATALRDQREAMMKVRARTAELGPRGAVSVFFLIALLAGGVLMIAGEKALARGWMLRLGHGTEALRLQNMLIARRGSRPDRRMLAREELDAVATMAWLHLTVQFNPPIVTIQVFGSGCASRHCG